MRKNGKNENIFNICIVSCGIFHISEFIISVGLNSSYKDIERKDNISQVEITQAQATLVNGKIKGIIKDSEQDNLTGKYVEIDLYSERDNMIGKRYVEINTTEVNREQEFSIYFEAEDVTSYSVAIVDEKQGGELEIIPEEWTKTEIIVATIFTLLIFW